MNELDSSRKTNILMLARALDTGGIERDVSKFARNLPRNGFQPHVACFNPGGMRWREIESAGVPLLSVNVDSFRNWSAISGAQRIHSYIKQHNIRLIHAFDIPADIFVVPLARLWGVPVLSSQLCFRDLCTPGTRAIMTVIDRLATGTMVNCEGLADHLENDWKVARKRIHICYNGFEPEEFHGRGRSRPDSLTNASIVVGTVALLRAEKNIGMLIEAFAKVLKIDPDAKLLLVGDGPEKAKLEQQAYTLQIREACVFQDTVKEPAEWMRAIDIFVLPSTSEGFSNSLLESMACGCCPVASRIGGTPELVQDRESGLLFESGNVEELAEALVYLARNPKARSAMARNALDFAHANLTIDSAVSRLAGIYNEILDKKIQEGGGKEFVPLRGRLPNRRDFDPAGF